MKLICITLALVLSALPVAAHDMWIEPTSFAAAPGKIIGLKLRVGDNFLGDPIPRNPDFIDKFISVDASGRKPVYGRDGADPAGLVNMADSGLLILGYQSRPAPVALPAATFNQYLEEEGLDTIAGLRARRNQTGKDVREVFSRCAKSLVLYGAPAMAQADRVLGFTLELVSDVNPYTLSAGQQLPVRLLYEGHPLPGALVVAMNRTNPMNRISARTDKKGRVTLQLPDDGKWLVKAVHMVPAPAGSNAEWASFWASLTFEIQK
jgi:uncharacterized GH25 family protein